MRRKKSKGLPSRQPGEGPATDDQLGYLRSLADIDEDELQALGKWQASHLITKLVEDRDSGERDHGARTHSIGGLFKLVFVLILAFIGWKGFSFVRDSMANSSSATTDVIPTVATTPARHTLPPKRPLTAESLIEPLKPKESELPAIQIPPGTLATLEDTTLPALLVTSEEITLRNSTGKEVTIPTGTGINVTDRTTHGTLTMQIGGALFVGNESRISGKVELK